MLERCLLGEEDAWEHLFQRYHPRLLEVIREQLGPRAGGTDLAEEVAALAEEVAASVWFSLAASEHARPRKLDPTLGMQLLMYLAALARREIWKRYRRERNRRTRKTRSGRLEAAAEEPR